MEIFLTRSLSGFIFENLIKIGIPSSITGIDKSYSSRRKYNVGRVLPEQWVFGGICREDRQCFLYAVLNWTAEMLDCIVASIQSGKNNNVRLLEIVFQWARIPGVFYTRYSFNRSENFVDSVSETHTKTAESIIPLEKPPLGERFYTDTGRHPPLPCRWNNNTHCL